ncbi:DoxX family protein [Pedobacter nototheniae]|uniref:DoxX family protein n=1 Tax=Pedobacter nototheniae TaxID=2488994 RepID=UPI002931BD71|nr:DoxX family protein [Pedobacter nototheniae]
MNPKNNALLLVRIAIAMIFLSHSLHGIFNGTVNAFGESYLNTVGFKPFGVFLAWAVILFEIVASLLILIGKYIQWVSPGLILILITGIILVHLKEGWYVVGPGRNGMEFSCVLILLLIAISLPDKKH